MGYDLIPKNKSVKSISYGAFWWPIFLEETGAGYVLGYGGGRRPGTNIYRPDSRGASPVSNDGYAVSSKQATMMATVVIGFVSVHRFINKEWEDLPEEQRIRDLECKTHDGKFLYKHPWHEDRLKQMEQFAEFAEKSKGFKIE